MSIIYQNHFLIYYTGLKLVLKFISNVTILFTQFFKGVENFHTVIAMFDKSYDDFNFNLTEALRNGEF